MADVHVYVAKFQPATRYVVQLFVDADHVCRNPARRLFRCRRCLRLRWACNMKVQVYYDGVYFWCEDDRACKAHKKAQGRKRYKRRKASLARRTEVR